MKDDKMSREAAVRAVARAARRGRRMSEARQKAAEMMEAFVKAASPMVDAIRDRRAR